MPHKSEKERRRQIALELRARENEIFERSLPIDRDAFKHLFDHLDNELGEKECDHSLQITQNFLAANNTTNTSRVLEWLREHHGYCDCEVLANVEELFET